MLALVASLPAFAQQAPARIALLIGNQGYDRSVGALRNPHTDIELVGDALRKQGFALLEPLKDARRAQILGAVRELVRRLNAAPAGAVGFIYYSGHGAAEKDTNINYLIPVDARDPDRATFWDESLKLDDILRLLEGARSAAKFVIFDACRNELQLTERTSDKGFIPVREHAGMFIGYSTAPGRPASDRGAAGGPYAVALAAELAAPGLDHLNLFQNVKEKVIAATGGAQQPWSSDGLSRRVPLTAAAPPPASPSAPTLSEAAIAWERLRQSQSVAVLEVFVRQFPGTVYAAEAAERIAEVRREADERQRVALLQKQETDRKRAEAEAAAKRKSDEEAAARAEADARARAEAAGRDPAASVVPGSGQSFKDRLADGSACAFCPEMVVVPAGSFVMGSPASEKGRSSDEGPQRRVTIAKPFAIGKFEVTFAEWDACVSDGACKHMPETSWGRGHQPVHSVSWDDITTEYLPWLSRKTGKAYRLLSEAEWEYAARAGTTTPFSFGATISTDQANYNGNFTYGNGRKGVYRQKTIEVGSLNNANAWGLHNVHGNVWEWVEDCWHDNYSGPPTDGSAWTTACGSNVSRVLRGGSWFNVPLILRSAFRFRNRPDSRNYEFGFRLARTLDP
jgi:formylglycine-generating enzyme required for sulfatase activity